MHFLKLSLVLVSLAVLRALAAPVPPSGSSNSRSSDSDSDSDDGVQHNLGDFVGVRPKAYEEKTKDHKKIAIHPGVIVQDRNPKTGKYGVAMISKKLPHNPPQEPVEHFHQAESSIYGNIALSPPKQVKSKHMKAWKDEKTGIVETPMSSSNLNRLDKAMAPHVGWEPPKPPTPPSSPEVPIPHIKGQKAGKGSTGGRAPPPLSGGHPPNPHWRAPHPNTVASSSSSSSNSRRPSVMYQQGARYPPLPNQGGPRSSTGPPNAYRPTGPNQAAYRPNTHPAPERSNNIARPVGYPPVNPPPNRFPPAGAYPPVNPAGHPGPLPASLHPGPYNPAAHPPTHPTAFHPSGYPAVVNPGGYPAPAMGHPGPHPAYKPSGSSRHPSDLRVDDNSRRPSGKPRDRPPSPDWRARKASKGKKPDYSRRPPVVRRSFRDARRYIGSQ